MSLKHLHAFYLKDLHPNTEKCKKSDFNNKALLNQLKCLYKTFSHGLQKSVGEYRLAMYNFAYILTLISEFSFLYY